MIKHHNTFSLGRADCYQQFQAVFYGWEAGAQHFSCGARDQGNVWTSTSRRGSADRVPSRGVGAMTLGGLSRRVRRPLLAGWRVQYR